MLMIHYCFHIISFFNKLSHHVIFTLQVCHITVNNAGVSKTLHSSNGKQKPAEVEAAAHRNWLPSCTLTVGHGKCIKILLQIKKPY